VSSGKLSIIRGEDFATNAKGYESVNIADIPTNAEMQLNCSDGSNELTVQLKNEGSNDIYIILVWGSVIPAMVAEY
jgi:hypothetical protein